MPHEVPNPLLYLSLALTCRSARTAFCSDYVWSRINPYGLESRIYDHFMVAKTVLNPAQRLNLQAVWEFVRGNIVGGEDTVIYRLFKGEIPNIDAGENEYYNMGLLLCTARLVGQPRLEIVDVNSRLLDEAAKLDPRVGRRCGGAELVTSDPVPFLEPRQFHDLDRNSIETELKADGVLLQFCSLELRQDISLVKIAVASDGRALRFASDELRQDKDLVLRARCSRYSVLEEHTYADPFYDQFAEGDPYLAIVNEMNKKMGLPVMESDEGLQYFDMKI